MLPSQVGARVFHYSEVRISGFGFFRIFALYGLNIDSRLLKFGMNDIQGGTEDFDYSDISGYPVKDFFGYFHFMGTILTIDL